MTGQPLRKPERAVSESQFDAPPAFIRSAGTAAPAPRAFTPDRFGARSMTLAVVSDSSGPVPAPHPGKVVAATYLTSLREAQGIEQDVAGTAVGLSSGEVARIESARQTAAWGYAPELMEHYGVADPARCAGIIALTAPLHEHQDALVADIQPGWQERLAAVENASHVLCAVSDTTFPPVVCSPKFTALMSTRGWPHPASRANGLAPDHRGRVVALLDESVLLRPFGTPEELCEQLNHVLHLAATGRAVVRIVPASAAVHAPALTELYLNNTVLHAVTAGISGVLYTASAPPAGHVDGANGHARASDAYTHLVDTVERAALTTEASKQLLLDALHRAAARHSLRHSTPTDGQEPSKRMTHRPTV